MEKGTECVGGWIQIRMKCPKRGHVRRNNDEIELRKWQSKIKYYLFIIFGISKPLVSLLGTFGKSSELKYDSKIGIQSNDT